MSRKRILSYNTLHVGELCRKGERTASVLEHNDWSGLWSFVKADLSRLLCGAGLVLAAGPVMASGWSDWVKVEQLHVTGEGQVWFSTTGNVNPDSCANSNYGVIQVTHPGIDRLYSGLLTAKATGAEIKYRVDGCGGDRPIVTSFYLR